MKDVRWDPLKSEQLKRDRGVSFEDILQAKLIQEKRHHPSRPHQNVMFFELEGYVWIVPYVESEQEIFLKTLYPSRKYTKLYREGKPI